MKRHTLTKSFLKHLGFHSNSLRLDRIENVYPDSDETGNQRHNRTTSVMEIGGFSVLLVCAIRSAKYGTISSLNIAGNHRPELHSKIIPTGSKVNIGPNSTIVYFDDPLLIGQHYLKEFMDKRDL